MRKWTGKIFRERRSLFHFLCKQSFKICVVVSLRQRSLCAAFSLWPKKRDEEKEEITSFFARVEKDIIIIRSQRNWKQAKFLLDPTLFEAKTFVCRHNRRRRRRSFWSRARQKNNLFDFRHFHWHYETLIVYIHLCRRLKKCILHYTSSFFATQ